MDDIVKKALEKWPNVPDCYGWLALDQRGKWYMRDDRIQAQGFFPHPKGSWLQHEKLIDFIGRNYQADELGRWFFQNGPQKVFVELETAPWVIRVQELSSTDLTKTDYIFSTHTGQKISPQRVLEDEQGLVYLLTELGLGVVHSQDMLAFANALETKAWDTEKVSTLKLEQEFHFLKSPQQQYS